MEEFDCSVNGPLEQQNWAVDGFKQFYKVINKLKQFHCPICKSLWPSEKPTCSTCSNNIKFTTFNNMVPNFEDLSTEVQLAFEQLTMIEEMFISPIQPIMSVFRLPSGGLVHRGYCASFSQDIQPVCDQLPRLTQNISLLIVQKKNKLNVHKDSLSIERE